jgi:tetratricopeptide (TPR) repeat protein
MKKISLGAMVFVLMIVVISVAQAQAPQKTLNQYISDLQKNPNDNALREKIIKHVQTMKPAPAIPEEARRYFVKATTLMKGAKDEAGFGLAVDAYNQALLIAPWWPEAYYNFSFALESSGRFNEAINILKLYLLTNPIASDARAAQDRIYAIEAKKELTEAEKATKAKKAEEERKTEKKRENSGDWLQKLDGRRYIYYPSNYTGVKPVIDVTGKFFVLGLIYDAGSDAARRMGAGYHENRGRPYNRLEIQGRASTYPWKGYPYDEQPLSFRPLEENFIISEDGNKITFRTRYKDGHSEDVIYTYQGSFR